MWHCHTRYAIERDGKIVLRALPTMRAANSLIPGYPGGKVIVDPRSLAR